MKQHFCSAENLLIQYEKECNWCGEKEWVGLTDEEVELYWDWEDFQTGAGRSTIFEMVRDIEAKLKEKNT